MLGQGIRDGALENPFVVYRRTKLRRPIISPKLRCASFQFLVSLLFVRSDHRLSDCLTGQVLTSQDVIGDPYFSLLELLIILVMPPVVIGLIALRKRANAETKVFGTIAVSFASIATTITCSVHFVILFASRPIAAAGLQHSELLFSFKWPSVAYALDILAWDFFFSLSLLFAVPLLGHKGLEKVIRILFIVNGVLSLAGLIGVPLGNMQVRMIGVVGYAGLSPFAFLLIGILLGQSGIGEKSQNKN